MVAEGPPPTPFANPATIPTRAGQRRQKNPGRTIAGRRPPPYLDAMTEPQETIPPAEPAPKPAPTVLPKEIGGTKGPEPTRYGDWEHKGRCTDF